MTAEESYNLLYVFDLPAAKRGLDRLMTLDGICGQIVSITFNIDDPEKLEKILKVIKECEADGAGS